MEKKKKGPAKKLEPVTTIRHGNAFAHIYLRSTQTGYRFYEYAPGRTFVNQSTGREGDASSLFAENEAEIVAVIRQASAWIRDQHQKTDELATTSVKEG